MLLLIVIPCGRWDNMMRAEEACFTALQSSKLEPSPAFLYWRRCGIMRHAARNPPGAETAAGALANQHIRRLLCRLPQAYPRSRRLLPQAISGCSGLTSLDLRRYTGLSPIGLRHLGALKRLYVLAMFKTLTDADGSALPVLLAATDVAGLAAALPGLRYFAMPPHTDAESEVRPWSRAPVASPHRRHFRIPGAGAAKLLRLFEGARAPFAQANSCVCYLCIIGSLRDP